jgi:hypothetical protein
MKEVTVRFDDKKRVAEGRRPLPPEMEIDTPYWSSSYGEVVSVKDIPDPAVRTYRMSFPVFAPSANGLMMLLRESGYAGVIVEEVPKT